MAAPAPTHITEDREVLDYPAVMRLLGVASRRTIDAWRKHPTHPLPSHIPPGGRKVRFFRDEVLDWLRRHDGNPSRTTPRAVKRRRKARR